MTASVGAALTMMTASNPAAAKLPSSSGSRPKAMLDHARVGPLDLDMLSDQQSIFVAGCNHQ